MPDLIPNDTPIVQYHNDLWVDTYPNYELLSQPDNIVNYHPYNTQGDLVYRSLLFTPTIDYLLPDTYEILRGEIEEDIIYDNYGNTASARGQAIGPSYEVDIYTYTTPDSAYSSSSSSAYGFDLE